MGGKSLEASESALHEMINVVEDGDQNEGKCGHDDEGLLGATVHESLLLT